jgi:hypothetical protein
LVHPQVGADRVAVTAIEMSTVCVTPLALVLVTLNWRVTGEIEAGVVTVSVADAGSLESGGIVTFEVDSANVTPAGGATNQAAPSCAVSLTPFSERSWILDDWLEDAMSEIDCGVADKV